MNALVIVLWLAVLAAVLTFFSQAKTSPVLTAANDSQQNPAWFRKEDDLEWLNPLHDGKRHDKKKFKPIPPAGNHHSQYRCRR